MSQDKCFRITVEGSGDSFQIIRDALDTQRLVESKLLAIGGDTKPCSLKDQTKLQQVIAQFNTAKLLEISEKLKLTPAQASRIFDTLLLYLIDDKDQGLMTLYKGYYRRKLGEINAKKLIKKHARKHIEFEGEILDVNLDELQSMPDELCKFLNLNTAILIQLVAEKIQEISLYNIENDFMPVKEILVRKSIQAQ